MRRAYGYLRVSSQIQIEKDGFNRQEKAIRIYAKENQIEIESCFKEEGISGAKTESERPAFQAMLNSIIKCNIKLILVERLDRLAREYRIQEQLLIYLASKGLELISADTGENVTLALKGDPMRQAMIQIQGVFAQLEKSLLVKKLSDARKRIRDTGVKCEGRHSYQEVKPEVLYLIKKLRRKPRNGRRMTYANVANRLNSLGYLSVAKKHFTSNNIAVIVHKWLQS